MKKILLLAWILLAANISKAQWEPDVRLTNNSDSSLTSYQNSRCIAAIDDFVHVVWYDNRDGNFEIYYKRSTNGGISWEPDLRLTTDGSKSTLPSIAVSGSDIHVVWQDYRDGNGNREIYYKRSTDGGSSWGTDTRLTNDPAVSNNPSIAVSGSVVHVVWQDIRDGNVELYYKRSTDGGITWGADIRLTNATSSSLNPSITVSGLNVHIVWNDSRDGNSEIYYKRSIDGGINWETDRRLTNDLSISQLPSVSMAGSVVHVVWEDNRDGNEEIYYKRSTDGGLSWGEDKRLTVDPANSIFSNIISSGSMVHVVWQDTRNGLWGIYYICSTDGGLNWGSEVQLNEISSESLHPFITVSGPVLHAMWYDFRDLNYEIYYKPNPTGGFPVGLENEKGDYSGQQTRIYPNPASNVIHINPDNYSGGKEVLSIRNILGKELLNKQIQKGESMVDVSSLQNGFYFVSVMTNKDLVNCTRLIIAK